MRRDRLRCWNVWSVVRVEEGRRALPCPGLGVSVGEEGLWHIGTIKCRLWQLLDCSAAWGSKARGLTPAAPEAEFGTVSYHPGFAVPEGGFGL